MWAGAGAFGPTDYRVVAHYNGDTEWSSDDPDDDFGSAGRDDRDGTSDPVSAGPEGRESSPPPHPRPTPRAADITTDITTAIRGVGPVVDDDDEVDLAALVRRVDDDGNDGADA